jgi:hypothetical protein
VPATRRALERAGITLDDVGVIELNEAFAAQVLASLRQLGVADDDPRVNPNGGAIALGHPLGMSGARLLLTASHELRRTGARYALATMCVGVGQGMATVPGARLGGQRLRVRRVHSRDPRERVRASRRRPVTGNVVIGRDVYVGPGPRSAATGAAS